jgi:NADH:ubiquinone oxidoreductase subunit 2 (subunit N)
MITIGPAIAVAIIVILGLFYLQLEHHTRKIKIAAIIAIAALIYFSITGIFTSDQVDLTSPSGIVNAVYLYVGWIGSTATELWDIGAQTTHMVGNAIKVNSTQEDSKK